ncbi:bifunctional glutamate N-acetyltransferase/amino-acid acetyltransferase ArgJ [Planktomarina sp.]|uniref:bifunctional glutamate N-acetyltransferase/amino-acid acetyltransferase ArgJ n=1 Tax=Planktomarina sp. TaxID=2024851 RepID=UPI0028910EF8|nr:bifunctional glutamate N-acetyltransferase/amino-acid acetyltransferase ArgJ [Planktomarina sp.]MDT2032195.1 bifunctional glutamate N-acetyltransferase/amino-acid acetyltransferase ArgJ [Planktomarina sp.]
MTQISPLAPKNFPDLPVIDGVRFATAAAGVKYPGRTDVMLASIAPGATIAGVFTRSATRAASVLDCQDKIGGDVSKGAAILVNSGNANAFTGAAGRASVGRICAAVATQLNIPTDAVFTSSTGVIGEVLPDQRIRDCLDQLVASLNLAAQEEAARAIMTTDTFPKGASKILQINGQPVTISGFAKGSGMIAPDMATMLVYIFTDAKISQPKLQATLEDLTNQTFNCITVDSDTSTSDALICAATGTSGVDVTENLDFTEALKQVMLDLAHQVVKDGEGATKFVTVEVTSARNDADARKVAMSIANSPLVKTAIAGEDPNWGRIVMAVGKSGAEADRDRLSIWFGPHLVAENGWVASSYTEEVGAGYMQQAELHIRTDLGVGTAQTTVWTCDLTHGYIEINADYRS